MAVEVLVGKVVGNFDIGGETLVVGTLVIGL